MTEEQSRQSSPPKERKISHQEMRNQDFVSRLLAATPPYMYSAPIGNNNFFFSDMLRSLVQARSNENARNLQLQQAALARRSRKRSWSQHRPYYEHIKERKDVLEEKPSDKPLELTNKQLYPISSKYSKDIKELKTDPPTKNTEITERNSPKNNEPTNLPVPDPPIASLPASDLVLPAPPISNWYPNLYPPYVDPLHFFIDLRVSGHFSPKKIPLENTGSLENTTALANSTDNNNVVQQNSSDGIGKNRHASAFSVPTPKASTILNLSQANKYYDLGGEAKENDAKINSNYSPQNLPRFYGKNYENEVDDEDSKAIDVESNRCSDDEDEVQEID